MVAVVGASGSGKSLLAHAGAGDSALQRQLVRLHDLLRGNADGKADEGAAGKGNRSGAPERFLPGSPSCGWENRSETANRTGRAGKSLAVLGRYGLDEKTERLFPFQLSGE